MFWYINYASRKLFKKIYYLCYIMWFKMCNKTPWNCYLALDTTAIPETLQTSLSHLPLLNLDQSVCGG
jgi:hypothetical protein